ncbi:MAG: hypothetical protein ACR2RA_00345 [Geminicoccaceae bacterium]
MKDVECVGEIFDQIFGPDDSVWMEELLAVGIERVGHDDEAGGIAVGQVVVEPVGGVDVASLGKKLTRPRAFRATTKKPCGATPVVLRMAAAAQSRSAASSAADS